MANNEYAKNAAVAAKALGVPEHVLPANHPGRRAAPVPYHLPPLEHVALDEQNDTLVSRHRIDGEAGASGGFLYVVKSGSSVSTTYIPTAY